MNPDSASSPDRHPPQRSSGTGKLVLVLLFLFPVGAGLGLLWLHRSSASSLVEAVAALEARGVPRDPSELQLPQRPGRAPAVWAQDFDRDLPHLVSKYLQDSTTGDALRSGLAETHSADPSLTADLHAFRERLAAAALPDEQHPVTLTSGPHLLARGPGSEHSEIAWELARDWVPLAGRLVSPALPLAIEAATDVDLTADARTRIEDPRLLLTSTDAYGLHILRVVDALRLDCLAALLDERFERSATRIEELAQLAAVLERPEDLSSSFLYLHVLEVSDDLTRTFIDGRGPAARLRELAPYQSNAFDPLAAYERGMGAEILLGRRVFQVSGADKQTRGGALSSWMARRDEALYLREMLARWSVVDLPPAQALARLEALEEAFSPSGWPWAAKTGLLLPSSTRCLEEALALRQQIAITRAGLESVAGRLATADPVLGAPASAPQLEFERLGEGLLRITAGPGARGQRSAVDSSWVVEPQDAAASDPASTPQE